MVTVKTLITILVYHTNKKENIMDYCKRLFDLRTDNDLKQEDIAKILNTTKQSYGRYENGTRKLSIEDLEKLCKFYQVSSDYIIGLTDNPKPNWTVKNQNIIYNNYGKINMK